MITTNYHGEPETFDPGMRVVHVSDLGDLARGTVMEVEDGLLRIQFDDGEEGWEAPLTCYSEPEG